MNRPWALVLLGALAIHGAAADNDSGPPHLGEVVGSATVIDGDSLYVDDAEVRLFGIDAFEFGQSCGDLACGHMAAELVALLSARAPVRCVGVASDTCGRLVAVCRSRQQDFGRVLVERGLALADRTMSADYVAAEEGARAAGAGAWAESFT